MAYSIMTLYEALRNHKNAFLWDTQIKEKVIIYMTVAKKESYSVVTLPSAKMNEVLKQRVIQHMLRLTLSMTIAVKK